MDEEFFSCGKGVTGCTGAKVDEVEGGWMKIFGYVDVSVVHDGDGEVEGESVGT